MITDLQTASIRLFLASDAEWYGVLTHLTYDVRDNLTAGVRGEWFRDQNGFRVCSPGRTAARCAPRFFLCGNCGLKLEAGQMAQRTS